MGKQGRHVAVKSKARSRSNIKLDKRTLTIAALAVLVISAILILVCCLGGGPKDMAEDYVDAVFGGDGQAVWDTMNMDAMLELAIDAGSVKEEDSDSETKSMIESFDEMCVSIQSECKEKYGEDWSYEIDIIDSVDMTDKELAEYSGKVDGIEVEDGVKVSLSISFTGSEGSGKDEHTITVLKFDGEWIVMGN